MKTPQIKTKTKVIITALGLEILDRGFMKKRDRPPVDKLFERLLPI